MSDRAVCGADSGVKSRAEARSATTTATGSPEPGLGLHSHLWYGDSFAVGLLILEFCRAAHGALWWLGRGRAISNTPLYWFGMAYC